jgi:hypothetical protein
VRQKHCCSVLLKQGANTSRVIRLVFWLRLSLCSWRNHRFLISFCVLCFLMLITHAHDPSVDLRLLVLV